MQCGLAFERPERERFRRTVTMLFADVVGSTALGERLDPEALSAVLTTYFEAARAVIEGHGGAVVKFIGDAIMAVFGFPVAHEDDAMRAVRAAYEIQQSIARINPDLSHRYDVTIAARMGVHTGEVAGEGRNLDENLIFGDTANTAARLEQHAGPGEVLLGRTTYGLVRDRVVVEPVMAMAVKGKAEPLDPMRLVSLQPERMDLGRRRPMIGRDAELSELSERYHRSLTDPGPHVVSIVGDAGVGKSRLLAAFTEEVAGEATVLTGRCLPYGEGITYWPVLEIIQQAAGIEPDDALPVAIEKLHQLGIDDDGHRAVEWIAQAIGLTDGIATSEAIAWASVTLLRRWAGSGPIVLALEDVHWAAETLLSLVEVAVNSLSDQPVFVILCSRPDLSDGHLSAFGEGKDAWPTIRLAPLAQPEVRQLLGSVLDVQPEPQLEAQLMAASGGNPLFLAQMATMLVEEGLVETVGGRMVATMSPTTPVPASIQALLSSRMDRLPVDEATVLSRAAVWGEEFDLSDVMGLVPEHLQSDLGELTNSLCRRGLLVRSRPRTTSLRFEHLLVRDVAYEQLTKQTRAELHEAAARRIEAMVDERGVQYDEIIGHHLEQAYRYQTDLRSTTTVDPQLAATAAHYLLRAGRRALRRQDAHAASSLLSKVVALTDEGDVGRSRVAIELGEALLAGGRLRDAERRFNEVRADPVAPAQTRSLAELCLTEVQMQMAPPDSAATRLIGEEAQRAMFRFAALGDDHAVNRAGWLTFMTAMKLGEVEAAGNAVEQLSAVATRLGETSTGRLPAARSMVLAWGPTPVPEALAATLMLLDEVRGDPSAEPLVLSVAAFLHAQQGDIVAARLALARQRELFENSGQRMLMWASWGQATGRVELATGDPALAEGPLRESYAALTEVGERGFASTISGQLAHVLIAVGKLDEAATFADACQSAARGDVLSEILWRTASAHLLAAGGDTEQATTLAAVAVDTALGTGWPNVQGDALLEQALVLRECGRHDEAARAAAAALTIYRRKQNDAGAGRATRLIGELGPPFPARG